ncbi:tail fiber domain-containing protein, partial [bacterium]|nr:tail fiber domain-containing protein [bacterium]
ALTGLGPFASLTAGKLAIPTASSTGVVSQIVLNQAASVYLDGTGNFSTPQATGMNAAENYVSTGALLQVTSNGNLCQAVPLPQGSGVAVVFQSGTDAGGTVSYSDPQTPGDVSRFLAANGTWQLPNSMQPAQNYVGSGGILQVGGDDKQCTVATMPTGSEVRVVFQSGSDTGGIISYSDPQTEGDTTRFLAANGTWQTPQQKFAPVAPGLAKVGPNGTAATSIALGSSTDGTFLNNTGAFSIPSGKFVPTGAGIAVSTSSGTADSSIGFGAYPNTFLNNNGEWSPAPFVPSSVGLARAVVTEGGNVEAGPSIALGSSDGTYLGHDGNFASPTPGTGLLRTINGTASAINGSSNGAIPVIDSAGGVTTLALSGSSTQLLTGNKTFVNLSVNADANTLVNRDSSANVAMNNYSTGVNQTSNATQNLSASSKRQQIAQGTNAFTYRLPNATTLTIGTGFTFVNTTSQAAQINLFDTTSLVSVPAESNCEVFLADRASGTDTAGTWNYTFKLPNLTYVPTDFLASNGQWGKPLGTNTDTNNCSAADAIVCVDASGVSHYTESFTGDQAHILAGDGTWIPVGSSLRFKEEVVSFTKAEADKVIDEVCNRPVSFTYKENKARHFGLIAEDVAQLPLAKQIVNFDKEGLPVSLRLEDLTVPLAMCVKDLKEEVVRLKKRMREIEDERPTAVRRIE